MKSIRNKNTQMYIGNLKTFKVYLVSRFSRVFFAGDKLDLGSLSLWVILVLVRFELLFKIDISPLLRLFLSLFLLVEGASSLEDEPEVEILFSSLILLVPGLFLSSSLSGWASSSDVEVDSPVDVASFTFEGPGCGSLVDVEL